MRWLILACGLLLAAPAAAQSMPKIDAQNCLDVAKKLDAAAWDDLSEQTKSYSRLCFAAYWCDKAKKIMSEWDYYQHADEPYGEGNENQLRWLMKTCGE